MDEQQKQVKKEPSPLAGFAAIAVLVIGGLFIFNIATGSNDDSGATTDSSQQQEQKSAHQQAFDDSGLRDEASSVSFDGATGLMTAQYEQGDKLDSTDMVRSALSSYIKLGLKVFELEDVRELQLTVNGKFRDPQGNPVKDIIARVSMSREKFLAQDWSEQEYLPVLELIQANATNMIIDPSLINLASEDIFYAP